jgi:L-ascorbate metabolism protein UlaG (beta-lactamase superfamily)
LRFEPQPLSEVISRLSIQDGELELFKGFLQETSQTTPSYSAPAGQARWRYFGHACVLVEASDGTNLLVDPIVAYEADQNLKRFTLSDLPERIDYVVLTHNHADHVLIETLLALRCRIDTVIVPLCGGGVADPSLKLMLESIGFKKVLELDSLASVASGALTITALPFLGEHGDLDIRSKAAWLVKTDAHQLLFAADSNNLEPRMYDKINSIYGDIETLFLGMECLGAPFSWTYGPLLPVAVDRKKDQTRRLNGSDFERGIKVVESLGCKQVYIYAMGAEPWLQYVTSIDPSEDTPPVVNAKQLIARCKELGIPAELLFGSAEVLL